MNKLGFGFLRLPKENAEDNKSIRYDVVNELVDTFLAKGGTYFDTAYTYLDGESERALRKTLVERYPRERYQIADKLPSWKVRAKEDCPRMFEEQLERCGVTYFDTYLIHWLNERNYRFAQEYEMFEFLKKMKEEGKVKRIGFSYHDNAKILDRILSEHPEVECVQLQINYQDWDSEGIQAQQCYETAVKHGKKVLVMEPVKGGSLAALPEKAEAVFKKAAPEKSVASWAYRFAQSLEEVEIVLSGMNTMEQLEDNLSQTDPLSAEEQEIISRVKAILKEEHVIACTGCNYCAPNCPMNIAIPQYFGMYNEYERDGETGWKSKPGYNLLSETRGKASECILCRACEENCPQKLPITDWLKKVAERFEKK